MTESTPKTPTQQERFKTATKLDIFTLANEGYGPAKDMAKKYLFGENGFNIDGVEMLALRYFKNNKGDFTTDEREKIAQEFKKRGLW